MFIKNIIVWIMTRWRSMCLCIHHLNFSLYYMVFGLTKDHTFYQNLGARRVTKSRFCTIEGKFWNDLWNRQIYGALCSLNVSWYTQLYVMKNCSNYVETLGAIVHSLVALSRSHPEYVHSWSRPKCRNSYRLNFVFAFNGFGAKRN
jgi:hypothetical protein